MCAYNVYVAILRCSCRCFWIRIAAARRSTNRGGRFSPAPCHCLRPKYARTRQESTISCPIRRITILTQPADAACGGSSYRVFFSSRAQRKPIGNAFRNTVQDSVAEGVPCGIDENDSQALVQEWKQSFSIPRYGAYRYSPGTAPTATAIPEPTATWSTCSTGYGLRIVAHL